MHSITCFLATMVVASSASQFVPLREWNYLNFTWPPDAEITGYDPKNNTLSGINYYDGYYYLSLPRMRRGVPATLVRIPEESSELSPLLEPYPSWKMNGLENCEALQNVQNLEIDSKGRLWIIDGGRTMTMSKTPVVKCAPKIVVHDINTNTTERVYVFPENVTNPEFTFLYDFVIDESDGGYAYISDNSRFDPGIIIFSLEKVDSWKIRHGASMKAQPEAFNITLDGITITSPINIAGISLGPTNMNGTREVYYCPMSSFHLYSINTCELKNKSNSHGMYQGHVKDYGMRASQTDSMIIDNADNLYYGLLNSNSIARWNVNTPFNTTQEVIASSELFFQWPKAFTFDDKGDLVVLTNKLHKFLWRQLDLNEINFRLMASNVGTDSYIFKKSQNTTKQRFVSVTEITTTSDNNVYFHQQNAASGNGRVHPLFPICLISLLLIYL